MANLWQHSCHKKSKALSIIITLKVRGKSEVVKLTEEAMDESDDDEEVNSAKKNADDKFVRQLLSGAQDVKNNEGRYSRHFT